MNISRELLQKSSAGAIFDENESEFAECVCESMVLLGSLNLQCISDDTTILSFYLQQVINC